MSGCSKSESKDEGAPATKADSPAEKKSASEKTEAKAEKPVAIAAQFEIKTSEGKSWNQDSAKAKVKISKDAMWQMEGDKWTLRVAGDQLAETGASETTDLNQNNTFIHFEAEIDGKTMMLGCKPAEDVKGFVKRSKLTEVLVEGSFEFEAVTCSDYMTGEAVEYAGLPFAASGTFSLPLK